MKKIFLLIAIFICSLLQAQVNTLTMQLSQEHPRYLTDTGGKKETLKLIKNESWAKDVFEKLKERTDTYIRLTDTQPDWLLSRLSMYWKSHATDVFIKGESFDHAGGEKAPVPTVRYTGTRGTFATHGRPKLEDVVPYDDQDGNVTFCNNSLPGNPMESVHPSKTGRNIENVNREIMGIARDAAFLYWLTDEKKYAKLAVGVFDTYMQGIYYRNVPIDLNHGHQQTLVGMSSFEVIHEDILTDIVPLYDFLYGYLYSNYSDKMDIYAGAFKKWADNIIANGVPHNNWNLMQARYVMNIGMILEDNKLYADGKGREYYIDYVLNRSSIRQWSLKKLADYGYDSQTGIWAECPGYSSVVLNDYTNFTNLFDHNLGFDLTKELPIIPKAVAATPQHLFPNRMICGFGDTHPGYLSTNPIVRMIENGQVNGKKEQEDYFTALLKCIDPEVGKVGEKPARVSINSFFDDKPLILNPKIQAGKIEDYVSPLFYAPNVSWLIQRNGMHPRHSLMISMNGSEGNHMHANGISMELYGKGYVLGPDAGIGLYLYSGLDYAEYYSQFPSHNTVCVDGISSYPIMKSNHAFRLQSCFPAPLAQKGEFFPVTYSEVYFREPESCADQTRLMGIVTTTPETGYYVDIFRSRKVGGGDKMHDYFYHNLGQTLTLKGNDNSDLNLKPTEELSFAGAHLYAYSYIYDKKVSETDKDVKATFNMAMKDGDDISMNLWMKGEPERKVFTALSPMTEGYSRTPGMPYDIKQQPTLTFVARQSGEAWNRPFVAVYEPSSVKEPGCIASVTYPEVQCLESGSHVGILVRQKNGRTDHIISSDNPAHVCIMGQMKMTATYALWGEGEQSQNTLFLGNGILLQTPVVSIYSDTPVNVLLERKADYWQYTSSGACSILMDGKEYKVTKAEKGKLSL
ncbi:heparinase II/III family protein [Bacteroides sp.]|uniref:heparinase II/III domain-containing protein n=1 Tax=Bacteroides sp. TaxID=29523 RepID=UPI0026399FFC|nr:heparinase II/III family protein [Bacteroides sp.]